MMQETPVEALAADLSAADHNVRARALAQLVRLGREAVPVLTHAFENAGSEVRMLAMRGLYEIADPDCAELFSRALDDPDERIRAYGAQGLARIGDSRALDALVRTLDDFPEVLRQPETPATDALTQYGAPALAKVAPLLDAPQVMTRVRAFLVIRNIVSSTLQNSDWDSLWRQLGAYDPRADGSVRGRAARQWADWIARTWPGE